MNSKIRILLFGAGQAGQRAFRYYKDEFEVIGFIDNNESLHGTHLCALPIYAISSLADLSYDKIFIASSYQKEIYEQLEPIVAHEMIEVVDKDIMLGAFEQFDVTRYALVGMVFYFMSVWLFTNILSGHV